ncbi:UvrD-helicase domain-containing protein ['Catharanthus roseus' aster yellows phytoplasma]|uniref:UvrD-helicase domain-containing protein n=1 Tax='Catharanthus roseus' aster yellows phytoplasma TaxID=1193712 RepID=UPI0013EE7D24|nr:ATP-dependent helicase ['Catharanthus roseus' aster yellows phytoplasma]
MYKLNQNQLKAIYYNKGSLNVSAGPGTGKTTVLIERVKYLVNQLNISPKDILILSFTKSSVQEIEKRLLIEDIKVMTFHGLSNSILKKNISLLNNEYNDNFEIIDDLKKEDIVKYLLKTARKTSTAYGFSDAKVFISKIKNNTINLKNNNFYNKYQNYLYKHNLIDFDDLNKYAYQILSNNNFLLTAYQIKYRYILIDEIQDIDFYQYQLINLLFKKTILFIIGDLNQSIYSFRGSKIIYIDLLLLNFNIPTFYLNINYRIPNKIVKLANNLINYNFKSYDKDKYKITSFVKDDCNAQISYNNFINDYIELLLYPKLKNW